MVEKKEKNANIPLEKLLLDTKMNKYQLIPLALRLVKELQKKEENIPQNVLLERALHDFLTGKIKLEEIEKLSKEKK